MSNLVPIDNKRANLAAPTAMQARMAQGGMADNFSAGTSGGFHVLSIRAGKFHLRFGKDNEQTIPDPATGYPATYLDVVLVNASKQLAKTFYKQAYSQGNSDQPDCWSLDSIRPDPTVQHKMNPTCQDCPMNAFGSRVTPDGKQAKACADSRRVAIAFPGELVKPDPIGVLLRVPQSSLRSLRDYVDLLQRNGYEPGGCVTRLSFDPTASYPKLMFRFVGPLTDQEFGTAVMMMDSPNTKAMLQGADLVNVSNVHAQTQLSPMPRQAPIAIGQGFGPGMLQQGEVEDVQQVEQVLPWEEPGARPETMPTIIDLPDGRQFSTVTGQYVEKQAAPQVDPDVMPLPDGKFFHRTKGTYVESQYVDAAPLTPNAAEAKAEPKKRAPRKPKEIELTKEEQELAEKLKGNPLFERVVGAVTEPEAKLPAPNGNGDVAKPTVVAASPKLEQLLSGLAPKKEGK